MQIEQFDAARDHEQARRCYDIVSACERTDDPAAPPRSLAAFTTWWSRGPAGDPRQCWLATAAAGQPGSGCYLLILSERENTTIASCSLYVAPEARRDGLGTQLLAHSVLQARQAGRSRLSCEVRDDSPGAAFAAGAGMTSGIAEVYRQLSVDASLQASSSGPIRAVPAGAFRRSPRCCPPTAAASSDSWSKWRCWSCWQNASRACAAS
jgi:GNAT superfamily N-acetyltransferase